MQRTIAIVLAAACGHAPPPAPKPAERPVAAVGDLAGAWSASDEMDFVYTLTVGRDGAFDLREDRNKLGKCEVEGTLQLAAGTLTLAIEHDDCHRDVVETQAPVTIEQFTGDAFVLTLRADSRAYHRSHH
ncbi:MAG TPA: hypothetical protein VGF94_15045 [Kofleriaceae bacterium]|jgi:hypothetical protein